MTNTLVRHDSSCRICNSANVQTVFTLSSTPPADDFVAKEFRNSVQDVYPLELAICKDCGYVYLPYVVNPEKIYPEFTYVSAVTAGLRRHYSEYAQEISATFNIPSQSLVVDLGSNDGSMLSCWANLGMRVVGVEPAQAIAQKANQKGLTTINDFFGEQVVEKILRDYGSATVIIANYTYANIDNVIGFTKAVAKLLSPEGIFIVQTGYHPEQMKIKMFDYIYHEHLSYFTVDTLSNLFHQCEMEIIQAVKTQPKGGSIRVVGQLKSGSHNVDPSVNTLMQEEVLAKMREPETYIRFASEIDNAKQKVVDLLRTLKSANKRIVGFGASHSTTTLIYHFGIASFLEYLVDDNPIKHSLYSPGYHIPVYSSEKMHCDCPDYVIILAWQHGETIIQKHSAYLESGGHFILPLPELEIRVQQ
ncbi:MAG: class I SAM-dependent methyltransferase [Spirulina sp. SIO3F2]|nr:class I SAM-dependent methyltransferase [Spirulina sp. SIO3F2]